MTSERAPTIASRSSACLQSFERLCSLLQDPSSLIPGQPSATEVQDELGRFRVWAGNIGALQEPPAHTSLDYRLRDAENICQQVLQILERLNQSILEATLIVSGQKPNRLIASVDLELGSECGDDVSSTDTESEEDAPKDASRPISEIRELFLSAAGSITSLFKLSIVIRNPTPRGRYAKSASMPPLDDSFDIGHVWQKYPHARETKWLVELLGKANTRRRQYFRYRERHGEKLSRASEQEAGEGSMKDSGADAMAVTRPEPGPHNGTQTHMSGSKPVTKITHTTATTLVVNSSDEIERHSDTGYSVTSYATSISEAPNSFRVPPPPEMSAGGKPFECPYCHTIQVVKGRRSWKKHVFSDLQPYVCTFQQCGLKMFSERHTWFNHELYAHRKQWYCNACSHSPFQSPEQLRSHIKRCHVGTFTEAQLPVLVDMCQIPVDNIPATACPLCDDWKVTSTDLDSRGSTIVVTPSQFRRHLGRHLEQLALFALPKRSENDAVEEFGSNEAAISLNSKAVPVNDRDSVESEQAALDLSPKEHSLKDWAEKGDLEMVRQLIKEGVDVNTPYEQVATPSTQHRNALQAAAFEGHATVAQLLLEWGADVNAQGGEYGNALQAASFSGHEMTIRLLLESGADVNAHGGHCGYALQAAASNGHLAIARLLLEMGADVNGHGGQLGTALQAAAFGGYGGVAHLLLEMKADINMQGGEFGNALQAAAYKGHGAVAQLLLKRGADVNLQSGYYGTALQAAAIGGHEAVAHLLLEMKADINMQGGEFGNALQAAAFKGHEAVAQLLLKRGADVNLKGGYYGSALQAAAFKGNEAIAQLLLKKGADVNLQGGYYGSALEAAAFKGHEAVAQLLLKRGADVNLKGGYHGSALQGAAFRGHEAVVQLLLRRGADVNLKGGYHGSALQAAAFEGHEALVRLLLEAGADVNAHGGHLGTALHAAAFRGHEAVVRLLLEAGAEVNTQDAYYGSPLHAAISADQTAVVRVLLENGADLQMKDSAHDTPLDKAKRAGQGAIVRLLDKTEEDVLTQREKSTLVDKPETLTNLRDLSGIQSQERLGAEEERCQRIIAARKKTLGSEHRDTISSMAKLASIYEAQERWKASAKLHSQVMKTRVRILGEEHPDTLASMAGLAWIYRQQEHWSDAEELASKAMEGRKRVLGVDHPDTQDSMLRLAQVFMEQGRLQDAEELGVQVMETRNRILGPDHLDTLSSIENVALIYMKQGCWKKAEDPELHVAEKRKKKLGPLHPNTIFSMALLASIYKSQGRLGEAEEQQTDVVNWSKARLGPQHPDTLYSLVDLSSIYRHQGRLEEAEQLQVEVMEIRRKVLGPEHPDTLASMANLASTYWKQRQWKKAKELEWQIMEAKNESQKPEYPGAPTSSSSLLSVLEDRRRIEDAEAKEPALPVAQSFREQDLIKAEADRAGADENAPNKPKRLEESPPKSNKPEDALPKYIGPGARWTKLNRKIVNPAALEEAKERFVERPDYVIVLRVLTREEIEALAIRTKEIRIARLDDYVHLK